MKHVMRGIHQHVSRYPTSTDCPTRRYAKDGSKEPNANEQDRNRKDQRKDQAEWVARMRVMVPVTHPVDSGEQRLLRLPMQDDTMDPVLEESPAKIAGCKQQSRRDGRRRSVCKEDKQADAWQIEAKKTPYWHAR